MFWRILAVSSPCGRYASALETSSRISTKLSTEKLQNSNIGDANINKNVEGLVRWLPCGRHASALETSSKIFTKLSTAKFQYSNNITVSKINKTSKVWFDGCHADAMLARLRHQAKSQRNVRQGKLQNSNITISIFYRYLCVFSNKKIVGRFPAGPQLTALIA